MHRIPTQLSSVLLAGLFLLPLCDAFAPRLAVRSSVSPHVPRKGDQPPRAALNDILMVAAPPSMALSGVAIVLKMSWRCAVVAGTATIGARLMQKDVTWSPAAFAAVAGTAMLSIVKPMLVANILYIGWGVGIGYGGTSLLRWLRTSDAPRARINQVFGDTLGTVAKTLDVRSKLRALLLKFDPSLEERQDETIGMGDLMMRGKKKRKKPPAETSNESEVAAAAEPPVTTAPPAAAAPPAATKKPPKQAPPAPDVGAPGAGPGGGFEWGGTF